VVLALVGQHFFYCWSGVAGRWILRRLAETRQFLETAVNVPGVVIENVWREGTVFFANGLSAYGSLAYPRIKFQTEDGREIFVLASKRANPPEYRVNQSVTILYNPLEPYQASI
jgi:hypothetical protein